MDSEATAKVIDMPAVAAEKAAKAEKRAARKAKVAVPASEAVKFESFAEGAEEAIGAYEAKLKAEADSTAVGKRFSDRIKQGNEKLKAALADGAATPAGKAHAAMVKAKARAKELTAAWEEAAEADKGPIGKAVKSLERVKEERATAKETATAKVERTASRFVKVMEQLKLSF